jgi:hypothetical protein
MAWTFVDQIRLGRAVGGADAEKRELALGRVRRLALTLGVGKIPNV